MTTSSSRTTSDLLVEALLGEGVDAVFGNPGTTELPLMEALAQAGEPSYYLGLQEIVCLGMADGYAQATGRPAVVNLHASPGLGNAMGNLYSAWRTRTPLLLTVGQQDSRFNLDAPLLHSDVVRQAEQYTKWAWELRRPDELAQAVRHAFKVATTPPTGPVFLSLPMDLMSEPAQGEALSPIRIATGGLPLVPEFLRAAELLREAQRPVLVVGDRVAARNATGQTVGLAEALGAKVWAEPMAQRLSFPPEHPLFCGFLPPFGPLVRKALDGADVAVLVGSEAFLMYPPFERGPAVPDRCSVIQIDDAPDDVGRSHKPEVVLIADLAACAEALTGELRPSANPSDYEELTARRSAQAEKGRRAIVERPTHPAAVATALGEVTKGRPVVDEAVSMTGPLQRSWLLDAPSERYGHRAGGLGWGLPAALGVSLARPGERTMALLGDGSAMYAIQGLWTAARYQLDLTVVILANRGYEIIRAGLRRQGGSAAAAGAYLGTDLADPEIDWASMASAMGLNYRACSGAGEIAEAALSLERHDGPGLLRVAVDGDFTLP